MIPDEEVERVRETADIVQVIGEHVNLRRTGTDYRGACPFHQGKHRNFSVSPRKRIYYCFVCHEGGDVFTFVQKHLGLDWPSAVRHVAEKAGIELREVDTRRDAPDPREPLWEVNAAAAEYFQRALWDEEAGKTARAYLETRRLSREIAERVGLGYAPRDAVVLRGQMQALGYTEERLLEAGLLVRTEGSSELRPRFRGRLMFPIQDRSGRHVGFGGRLLGPGEPKYLNSPESPVFSKGQLLYGLTWARHAIRREERLLLVEGYFDVVRLLAVGIESAVAPLGTALTEAQAELIARLSKSAFLLYDSDDAGLKATFRAGDELLGHGVAVHVVTLPEGEDPDSYAAKYGREKVEDRIGEAVDLFERKVQILERNGWFADLRRKRSALDKLLPTIRRTRDPLTREMYITRAAEVSGVPRDALLREIAARGTRRPRDDARAAGAREPGPPPPDDGEPPPWEDQGRQLHIRVGDRRTGERRGRFRRGQEAPPSDHRPLRAPHATMARLERDLMRVMLHVRGEIAHVASEIGPEVFRDERLREIFTMLLDLGAETPVDELAGALSEAAVQLLQGLLEERDAVLSPTVNPAKTVRGAIARLRERDLDDRLDRLKAAVDVAPPDEQEALRAEIMRLSAERKAGGGKRFNLGRTTT